MRSAGVHLAAAGAVFRRDLALFASYRTRLATTTVSTLVGLTLFYYVSRLVASPRVGGADGYYEFVVVGIAVFGVLTSTLALPVATLRAELFAGTFERLVLSPFGAVRAIASLLLFPLALAWGTAAVSLAYAAAAFGLRVEWPGALLAAPVALLGVAAFAPFGLLMAAAVVVFKQTNAGATLVLTAMTLLAGVYFPVDLLPGWIRWAAGVQPFTPAVDLLRHLLVGARMPASESIALLKLAAFAAVMGPMALLALAAAVRHGRRRGTIIEH